MEKPRLGPLSFPDFAATFADKNRNAARSLGRFKPTRKIAAPKFSGDADAGDLTRNFLLSARNAPVECENDFPIMRHDHFLQMLGKLHANCIRRAVDYARLLFNLARRPKRGVKHECSHCKAEAEI